MKLLDLNGLTAYHKLLMKYINSLVINRAFEYTNCPNCGAIITGDKCDFCGTLFKKNNDSYLKLIESVNKPPISPMRNINDRVF